MQILKNRSYYNISKFNRVLFLSLFFVLFFNCKEKNKLLVDNKETITIYGDDFDIHIKKKGFQFEVSGKNGEKIAPAHPISGILMGQNEKLMSIPESTEIIDATHKMLRFKIIFKNGNTAKVDMKFVENGIKFSVIPERKGKYDIVLRTASVGKGYGMADHAAYGEGAETLVLDNFIRDPFEPEKKGHQRMMSNFVVFPAQGFANINIYAGKKSVRVTDQENAQGSKNVEQISAFYYFVGSPKQIYKAYLTARNTEGYPVFKPKYELFGVGWEAFGALSWNTNEETVTNNINQYLDNGYPLKWMVVGSGFWPSGEKEFDSLGIPIERGGKSELKALQSTTSFGMWDKNKYPDPKKFIKYFHDKELVFLLGLRICFVPGGTFTSIGTENNYFIKDEVGKDKLFQPGFPKVPVYLLDTQNPKAVKWYISLCQKWLDYGVDGFKEDLFNHPGYLNDDLLDPVNRELMAEGVYIMGRNAYLGSPADIHRYEDFNYSQLQDRGPINGLAFAFSGFPNVYPDIIGGTGLSNNRWGTDGEQEKLKVYMIRYAQYASLNPSMSFGYGPWNLGEEVNNDCLKTALLHDRLQPYFYSNAVRSFNSGFPYPMTPLPLAYPQDKNVYGLANTQRRSYEWMIGDALLAFPLYGDDYYTTNSRDVYLPEGTWIDYDSGEVYKGPTTLNDFSIPLDKTPLFVGGTGVVVEKINEVLKVRVYPVTNKSKTIFYGKDGFTESEIFIENPNWNAVNVIDSTTGEKQSVIKVRHAFEFTMKQGHNYIIK